MGGNVAYHSSASGAVGLWVAQGADYNYETNSRDKGAIVANYTQVVWRESTHLGCAVDTSTCRIYVCNHAPGGNIGGQKPY